MDALRRIDLNLLLVLHALLTEQHVSRAALRLHKSQPAVSHSLAQLRAHFDDPLLVRRGGQLVRTARADALLAPLADALGNLDLLLAAPAIEPAQLQRRFRLALSDYAAQLVLPGLMPQLRQQAPGVDLLVSQASREAMVAQLIDGELDLALGVFPEAPATLQRQALFEEHFVCVADRHTLPPRGGLALAEWLARPHVMVAMRPDAQDEIEITLAAQGLRRRLALVLPHWGAALDVLTGTDLVLTIASRALHHLRRYPALRQFAAPLALPRFTYAQAWHERKAGDSAHQWLRQAVAGCDTHRGKHT